MPWVVQDDGSSRRAVYLVAGMADNGVIAHFDYLSDEPPATPDSPSSRPRAKNSQRPLKPTVSNKEDRSKRGRTPRRRPDRREETPSGAHHS